MAVETKGVVRTEAAPSGMREIQYVHGVQLGRESIVWSLASADVTRNLTSEQLQAAVDKFRELASQNMRIYVGRASDGSVRLEGRK